MDESMDIEDDEDGGGKKSKKKIFIIVMIMLGLTVAVIAFMLVTREKNIVVDAYVSGEETVDSLTTLVGERKMKEELAYEVDGISKKEYVYEADDQTEADLEEYTAYLVEERDFTKLEANMENQPEEVLSYEAYAIAAAQKGYVFEVEIISQEDQFSIAVSTHEGKDPKAKEEEKQREFTRNDAKTHFENFLTEHGNLPKPLESYSLIFDVGQTTINGEICYGITVYEAGVDNCNTFVEKYYMSLKDRNIYLYDNVTRTSALVESQTPAGNQSKVPEEGSVTVGAEAESKDKNAVEDAKERKDTENQKDQKDQKNTKD